jgi:monoamine oxidase
MAAEPAEISLHDYASLATGPDMMVEGGFGALVATLAEGLDIRLSTPVETIRWGDGQVSVEGPFGTLAARAAIVTVPTSLLAAGAIRFDPDLPGDKRAAFDALPLGAMDKIGMRLAQPLEEASEYALELGLLEAGRTHVLHLSPDRRLATVLATGDTARALSAAGSAAARAFGAEVLAGIAGSTAKIEAVVTTDWLNDPLARGAYSHCRVGGADARLAYAEPLADRLFFACEAAGGGQALTVGGAYQSGEAAAERIITTLRG